MTEGSDPGAIPGIDPSRVECWLLDNVAGLVAPVTFSLISGGHSNITYRVRDAAGTDYVLRRPPLGGTGGGAHDMGREFRVIAALQPTEVPVPVPLALCEDPTVNGAPFYVMSHVAGHVVDSPLTADSCLPEPAARRRAGEQIVDVLAGLHAVDIDTVGLGGAARRESFLARQLKRFKEVWERNKTRELPAMVSLASRLEELAPPQRHTGIVHSDYRLGNVMLGSDGTLLAVLDWELWTLGDVLADLGFLLNNWYEPDDPDPLIWMETPPTVAGGFGGRADVLERYAARTGFDLSAVEYYRAFQYWKVGVLAEGVKRRYESAQMPNAGVDFDHLDQRVLDLAELAEAHLSAHSASA